MLNPDNHRMHGRIEARPPPPVSPRISFSNGFILDSGADCLPVKYESSTAVSSTSSDFEFSVGNYQMMTADKLFFNGQLLPMKDYNGGTQKQQTPQSDQLLSERRNASSLAPSLFRTSSKLPHWCKSLLGVSGLHSRGKKYEKKKDKHRQGNQGEKRDEDREEEMHSWA